MHKPLNSTLFNGCNYLSLLVLNLCNFISRRGPRITVESDFIKISCLFSTTEIASKSYAHCVKFIICNDPVLFNYTESLQIVNFTQCAYALDAISFVENIHEILMKSLSTVILGPWMVRTKSPHEILLESWYRRNKIVYLSYRIYCWLRSRCIFAGWQQFISHIHHDCWRLPQF